MHRKESRMKLGYCYKTKEGMYSITVDEEFLDSITQDVRDAVEHLASNNTTLGGGEIDIYRIWNLASIYMELNELKKSEGV